MDPLLFQEKFDQLSADLAPLFTRREPRAHAAAYVRGSPTDLPRKNCWTLPEHTGQERAFGMQRLLHQAVSPDPGRCPGLGGSTHRFRGSLGSPPDPSGTRWSYSASASGPAYP